MIDNRQEVPLPTANLVVSITDVIKVTRSGRVFGLVSIQVVEDVVIGKKAYISSVDPVRAPTCLSGESSGLKVKDVDNDEVLRLIKKSEFNIMEQLIQSPSKISMLSLLMNSKAHREALQKVLEQAYVEHNVTMDQFDHIVANITSCNNLSFCDEELPEQGINHNLGRPWIHEAGSVTSTLHQKLKLFKNGKVVVGGGEKVLLVSHLSSFTYVEAEEEVGTLFEALSIADETQKTGESMSSLKDAKEVVQDGDTNNGGFTHGDEQHSVAIIEDDEDKACANLVTHGQTCSNWVVVDAPVIMHRSKLVLKPIEHNDPTPSPNLDFPVFEAEEENNDENVYEELSRLLETEERTILRLKSRLN
ncbi:hypothetical protein KIW84_044114 [Lathyrus oleraceus]|uniref:Uncharacterized protein n=1 Tax=Pisum sativum TaxID=3888 RepID=A0A9D5ASL5_PEA|nr:hypothetical protein KIW84_044114 [Pisum sativum]